MLQCGSVCSGTRACSSENHAANALFVRREGSLSSSASDAAAPDLLEDDGGFDDVSVFFAALDLELLLCVSEGGVVDDGGGAASEGLELQIRWTTLMVLPSGRG